MKKSGVPKLAMMKVMKALDKQEIENLTEAYKK